MHSILRFCLYIAVGYGTLVAAVYLLQRKMIYFPDRAAPPADAVNRAGLKFWPAEGQGFKGYASARAKKTHRATVVVFHGNAGSAWHRDYYVHALEPLGYHVILAEYPGYGGRSGKTTETSFVKDAREILQKIHAEVGGTIYLLGESMGCGVVAAVARNPSVPIGGLILITPWDSLSDLAQTLYWYLPARWLTRDRFDNIRNLHAYSQPVAMVIAEEDQVVPNRHSLRLFASLTGPKRIWRFEHAGHNSWPTRAQAPWWREVMQFVSAGRP